MNFHAAEKCALKAIELQCISVGIFLTFDNFVMMSFYIILDKLITPRRQREETFSFSNSLRNSNKLKYISYEANDK